MFEKPKRYVNKNHIELMRSYPCMVCGKPGPSDVHHWKSQKSGGSDHLNNLVSLSRDCHVEFHTIGAKTFWTKYGSKIKKSRKKLNLPNLIVKGEWDA